MRLLLDTHLAIWAVLDDPQLGNAARAMIEEHDLMPVVSVVTIWEIAIKFPFGDKRPDPMPFHGTEARAKFEGAGYAILAMTGAHAAVVDELPPLHGDPFDRMLVAQARAEGMTLLTRDARLREYGGFVVVV